MNNDLGKFGLMHYANIMALAADGNVQLAKEMYAAWNQENAIGYVNSLEDNYPKYIILWRTATTRAKMNVGDRGEALYKAAIMEATKGVFSPTVYAAGLAIQAEYNGLLQGTEKQLELLRIRHEKYMQNNIPQTMKGYFEGWEKLFIDKNQSKEEQHQRLLLVVKKIPIL